MTKAEKGDRVATLLWKYLQEAIAVELVPWNKDPIDNARSIGYRQAIKDVVDFMRMVSQS